jgi:hypothetical protein
MERTSSRSRGKLLACKLSAMLSGRRAPGIGIITGLLPSIQLIVSRCGDTPRRIASAPRLPIEDSLGAFEIPPKGECDKKAIPYRSQAETTPWNSALLSHGLYLFCTLAIGVIRRASSICGRLTLHKPISRILPTSRSFARAPTVSLNNIARSGVCS